MVYEVLCSIIGSVIGQRVVSGCTLLCVLQSRHRRPGGDTCHRPGREERNRGERVRFMGVHVGDRAGAMEDERRQQGQGLSACQARAVIK